MQNRLNQRCHVPMPFLLWSGLTELASFTFLWRTGGQEWSEETVAGGDDRTWCGAVRGRILRSIYHLH